MEILANLVKDLKLPTAPDLVTIVGQDPILPSPFLIGEAGAATLGAIGCMASELWCLKNLKHNKPQQISLSVFDAAIAQRSHEYVRVIDGENQNLWRPISGFYQTKDDRWIQFHCNFPEHQRGVLELLDCHPNANRDLVAAKVKHWVASELEDQLAHHLCAAIVRKALEWDAHPQAQAVNSLPLMEIIQIGDSPKEPMPSGPRPLSGIKMLDLTRVIAGPVCGKTFAEHGATVMRIASPQLPFILPLVIDTSFGKLSAFLDLNQKEEHQQLIRLMKGADIFSQSYRPSGLNDKGFSPEECARLRPGIIYISFSAYSHVGPWAARHGYDSLVQSATGIVTEQSNNSSPPKHLPAQALDYVTGFLAAIGAMAALKRRALNGGSYLVRVSLIQTAHWFKRLRRVAGDFNQCKIPTHEDIKSLMMQQKTAFGEVQALAPVLKMSQTMPRLERTTVPLGFDPPTWPH